MDKLDGEMRRGGKGEVCFTEVSKQDIFKH